MNKIDPFPNNPYDSVKIFKAYKIDIYSFPVIKVGYVY